MSFPKSYLIKLLVMEVEWWLTSMCLRILHEDIESIYEPRMTCQRMVKPLNPQSHLLGGHPQLTFAFSLSHVRFSTTKSQTHNHAPRPHDFKMAWFLQVLITLFTNSGFPYEKRSSNTWIDYLHSTRYKSSLLPGCLARYPSLPTK